MKMLSIGANVINYKDKQTKEPRTMLCLHCVKKNVNTRGLATEQFFVKDDSPLYSNIMAEVKGALDELVLSMLIAIQKGGSKTSSYSIRMIMRSLGIF